MKRVNFDNLKNIKAPESLINSALNVPKQEKKKPFLLRYYQYAVGFAAAVAVAVGVSMLLLFGSGSNSRVTIPSTSPQNTTQAEYSADSTGKESAPALEAPSTEKYGTAAVTEPAETETLNSTATQKPKQQSASTAAENTKAQGETEPNSDGTVQEQTESDKTERQEGTEILLSTQTAASGIATQPASDSGEKRCVIVCEINSPQLEGSVYCKLVGDDGSVLGSQNLFDASHKATEKSLGGGKIELTYIVDGRDVKPAEGKMYFAVFYDDGGEILKQSTMIYLHENLYFFF